MGKEKEFQAPDDVEEKVAPSLYARTDLMKAMSEYLVDALPRVDFVEDHFWTNIRILLCLICVGFGCYAQFGAKFPQDRLILALCVGGYFAVSGILACVDYFITGSSVMCVKIGDQSVFVELIMASFSPDVTISLRTRGHKVLSKKSVAHYFDSNGVLRQENIFGDFMKLVKQWEKEQKGGKAA